MVRKRFILVAVAVVLLAAAVFTYISLSGNNTAVDKNQALEESTAATDNTAAADSVETAETTAEGQTPEADAAGIEIVRREDIEVRYNSPEYDLRALLCEDTDKRTFVKLEYYLDGAGTTMEIDSFKISELADIFEKRDQSGTSAGAYKVRYAYLNPGISKVYLQITGSSNNGFEETALYSLNLKDFSIKKLTSYNGKFTDMSFNKDFSLLGYSFNDPPQSSAFQENSLLEVLDCKTDEFKVKGSRVASGKIAGTDRDPAFIYDYTFISWQSNIAARLKQATFPKKGSSGKLSGQGEVLYDVSKDRFTNLDGSPAANPETGMAKDAEPVAKGGVEAEKVLTDFYSFLPSEKDYKLAMNLLDESFRLRLDMLQQFGVLEIIKSDIDTESASMYSDILKAARLDYIVETELADGVCTVYYYQSFSLNADSQVRQALSAQIRKVKDTYKILLIKDADAEKPPFVQ